MTSLRHRVRLKTRHLYAITFLSILLLYVISFPENRHENDDGYHYAYLVREKPITELSKSKFVLYLPLMKVLYTTVKFISPITVDTYFLLCFSSAFFSSAALLLLFYLLHCLLKLGLATSLIGTALFMFAYDQWRYAIEADVYALSNLLILINLSAWISLSQKARIKGSDTLWVGLVSGLAVLMYKPNIIPLFLCFPLLLLMRRQFSPILIFSLTGGRASWLLII